MPVSLARNISALQVQRYLRRTSAELSTVYERLSSGLRIDRAGDDPAGMQVAAALRTDELLYSRILQNTRDGLSLISVYDGALENLTSITYRLEELAEQAANGAYSAAQRAALDTEAQALVDEFDRIVASLEFNGREIVAAGGSTYSLQVGTDSSQNSILDFTLQLAFTGGSGSLTGAGTFEDGTNWSATLGRLGLGDFNEDGFQDVIALDLTNRISLGNGDGTYKAATTFAGTSTPTESASMDIDGDGNLDLISTIIAAATQLVVQLGNGDGTFTNRQSFTTGLSPEGFVLVDVNADNEVDAVSADRDDGTISVLIGNGDGTFLARSTFAVGVSPYEVESGDFNGDGNADLAVVNSTSAYVSVLLGNGDGTFKAQATLAGSGRRTVTIGDFNGDGELDLVTNSYSTGTDLKFYAGNGDGTFKAAQDHTSGARAFDLLSADFNGDGALDVAYVNNASDLLVLVLGNGDGTFKAITTKAAGDFPSSIKSGDLNGDGVIDLLTGNSTDDTFTVFLQTTALAGGGSDIAFPEISLLTQESAQAALTTLDGVLTELLRERGVAGAILSRLDVIIANTESLRTEFSLAAGRILDADIAQEVAELVRLQVLQQAQTALLAQANLRAGDVLRLLQ